jgi:hypothetical protein
MEISVKGNIKYLEKPNIKKVFPTMNKEFLNIGVNVS